MARHVRGRHKGACSSAGRAPEALLGLMCIYWGTLALQESVYLGHFTMTLLSMHLTRASARY